MSHHRFRVPVSHVTRVRARRRTTVVLTTQTPWESRRFGSGGFARIELELTGRLGLRGKVVSARPGHGRAGEHVGRLPAAGQSVEIVVLDTDRRPEGSQQPARRPAGRLLPPLTLRREDLVEIVPLDEGGRPVIELDGKGRPLVGRAYQPVVVHTIDWITSPRPRTLRYLRLATGNWTILARRAHAGGRADCPSMTFTIALGRVGYAGELVWAVPDDGLDWRPPGEDRPPVGRLVAITVHPRPSETARRARQLRRSLRIGDTIHLTELVEEADRPRSADLFVVGLHRQSGPFDHVV